MRIYAEQLAIGNAVDVFVRPDPDALSWRLLRKSSDSFTGQDDPDALLVTEGVGDDHVIDFRGIKNGIAYYYRAYAFDGAAWRDSGTATISPSPTYEDNGLDPQSVVRARMADGLAVEVSRNTLSPASGEIKVLTAPPQFEAGAFPVVVVHMDSDEASERFNAELLAAEYRDEDGIHDGEGWMSRIALSITGWSLNPDERLALRRAIKRILVGNLPVFEEAGFLLPELSMHDTEDFSTFPAPIYMTAGLLTCLVPFNVSGTSTAAFEDVAITANSAR